MDMAIIWNLYYVRIKFYFINCTLKSIADLTKCVRSIFNIKYKSNRSVSLIN